MIHPDLLNLLICPVCKSDQLTERTDPSELVCTACGTVYPISDGIPILIAPAPGTPNAE